MRFLAFAAVATLTAATPLWAQDKAYDANTPVAVVNGTEITLGHVIALRERLPQQYQGLGDDVLFPGIIDQLIDQALIADTLSPNMDSDPLRLKLTLANERWAMLSNIVVSKITEIAPTDEELQAAYEEIYSAANPKPEYRASHILVETEDEANALVTALDDGAEFAELAKEKSTGPSGPNGGDLGWFPPGAMVPAFDTALQEMEVGAVSAPVETQFGWHVIKLNGFRERPEMDSVREELQQKVIEGKVETALDELRAAAAIERLDHGVPSVAVRDDSLID